MTATVYRDTLTRGFSHFVTAEIETGRRDSVRIV
jgi:hypothetical protein